MNNIKPKKKYSDLVGGVNHSFGLVTVLEGVNWCIKVFSQKLEFWTSSVKHLLNKL